VGGLDNRRLARVAKLAGAPGAAVAGVVVHKRLGDRVEEGEPLFEVHAEVPGELAYALEYVRATAPIFTVEDA
jgi:thymidine phosphorylase